MKKKPLIICLTGGLGNQLFQVANALAIDMDRELLLEWKLGKPRCSQNNLPEVASLQLPKNVKLLKHTNYSHLASKTSGYILRTGLTPKKWETFKAVKATKLLLANFVLSLHFRKSIKVFFGKGVGYSKIVPSDGNSFIVGYFQSCKFTENEAVFKELRNLKLIKENENFAQFEHLSSIEKPIIVHFRFGDYKFETLFGIPDYSYYKKCLDEMVIKFPESKIWVFSDEESEARKVFPQEYLGRTRWFTDRLLSSAETLELMTLGNSYIIANSTFSWWGAALSKTLNPVVMCPKGWFQFASEPLDLIPPSWKRVTAW